MSQKEYKAEEVTSTTIAASPLFTAAVSSALSGFRLQVETAYRRFKYQPGIQIPEMEREIDGFQTECLERIRTVIHELID